MESFRQICKRIIWKLGSFCYRNNFLRDHMPDKMYLQHLFAERMGYQMDFNNPKTFNEKLQWLKLHDRKPIYTVMVDKVAVKDYVRAKIGDKYIIPTLGVYSSFSDIDFTKLPNRFVLKCSHDSGSIVICKDKNSFDYEEARRILENGLKRNWYLLGREWPYKNVPPRIIAEQYLEDTSLEGLLDYKLMSFNGKVKFVFVCTRRNTPEGLHVTFYDLEWNILPFTRTYPREEVPCRKPESLGLMIQLAEQISKDVPFSRIDFYEINSKPYFGEITFYPGCGFEKFEPDSFDTNIGEMLNLPDDFLKEEDKCALPTFFGGGGRLIDDSLRQYFIYENLHILDKGLIDYKFFCFNGEPKIMYISNDHSEDPRTDFFDMNFNHLPILVKDRNADVIPDKPIQFEEMREIARILSKGIPHLRVDFYLINSQVYFGEMTFFHNCGLIPVKPEEWNNKMGDWIDIKQRNE